MMLLPNRNDDAKIKTLHGCSLMPIRDYKNVIAGRYLDINDGGTLVRVKVTSVQTWKRRGHPRQGHTEIHAKFGLYTYLTFSSDHINDAQRIVTLNGVKVKQYPVDQLPDKSKEDLFKDMECTFDYSLPQMVLNDLVRMSNLPYRTILSTTVWAYPDSHKLSGLPISCAEEIQAAWDLYFPVNTVAEDY